jgi:hypothetical protein
MKIEFIQVFDFDLNIAKRLNEVIEPLPNNWICLTDQDTLKFEGFAKDVKELIESGNITKKDLTGCMTNRLNPNNKAVIKELFNAKSIDDHHIQSVVSRMYGNQVEETDIVAGACMIFHKELFNAVGGFDESKLYFDKDLSRKTLKNGGRLLIARGIYIFHLYRWGKKDPVSSIDHLKKQKKGN